MPNVNTDRVNRLIELANEFHSDQSVQFRDEPIALDENWQAKVLEPHAENPILSEFRSAVDELNPDEQQQIVAMMWVGRGDYEMDEWDEALEYAGEAWTPDTADYLIAHPMLGEHLASGVEMFDDDSDEDE